MSPPRPTGSILKLGGSLLDWPELPAALGALLSMYDPVGIVVGGGRIADCVRQFHRQFHITQSAAHAIAIHSMSVTEQMVAALMQLPVAHTASNILQQWQQSNTVVIQAESCLQSPMCRWPQLPSSWETTSDSIAAALAIGLETDLKLVKSTDLTADNWRAASCQQLVDDHFPALAAELTVEWVNLRTFTAGIPTNRQSQTIQFGKFS